MGTHQEDFDQLAGSIEIERLKTVPVEITNRLRTAVAWLLPLACLLVTPSAAQLLPRPPQDSRPEKAQIAFEAGRYEEAADLLEQYLRKNPENAEGWLFLGWSRYRLGDFALSTKHFERSLEVDPRSIDALVGLGYASLQTIGPEASARRFAEALKRDETRGDALRGLVLAGRRQDAPEWVIREGISAAQKLERLEGKDVETLISSETLRAGREKRLRPPVEANLPLSVHWRAGRDYLERSLPDGSWQPAFIKGVNLVVSLPGRFPSDHPTDEKLYLEWLSMISGLGANTVRLYTLLPPAFYRALATHNEQQSDRPLWLIQGIWNELPLDHDFADPAYRSGLELEIARIVDAVHGNLAIGPRPGKAWGNFDQDVSPWLLSFLLGRNWEPFAVQAFNEMHQGESSWQGEWFEVLDAQPMEIWIARIFDYTAAYQARRYRALHPLTFLNWPSLDPLDHPTESTRAEENAWRSKAGLPLIGDSAESWEDDVVSLDATKVLATGANPAGVLASYQIYPYFPDFMNHQYAGDASDGPSSYEKYLAELKAYHGEQPVLVIEFGISTSRGVAHVHSGGRHHGGHGELEQGELLATMIGEIHDQRYAGGVIFSFIDQWARTTWNTAAFEIPSERAHLWLNVQSPDQSFGLMRLAPTSAAIAVDGAVQDWSEVPVYATD